MGHIEAVVVNHNTSLFTELALRSLFYRHHNLDISVTVMDNHSNDDIACLRKYCDAVDVPIVSTPWALSTPVNTHGEILEDFVLTKTDCDFYLFLDADAMFVKDNTLNIMLEELDETLNAFGIQSTISTDGETELPKGTRNLWGNQVWINTSRSRNREDVMPGKPLKDQPSLYTGADRLHPYCSLIKNTTVFRRVVQSVGLSVAQIKKAGGGEVFDTAGLMSRVMQTHGYTWLISKELVIHFFSVSYNSEYLDEKTVQCKQFLEELRAKSSV